MIVGDADGLTLGFAGGLFDADTGLTRFGARDYDPEVGRWTAKDPRRYPEAGTNSYVYAFSNPVLYMDPDGELPLIAGFFIGAGIDLAVQLATNGGRLECVDWSNVLVSGAFGLVSGGVGAGIKALNAARSTKLAIGAIAGAEIGVARVVGKESVNQVQGIGGGPVSGGDFATAAGLGAVSGGFGQVR